MPRFSYLKAPPPLYQLLCYEFFFFYKNDFKTVQRTFLRPVFHSFAHKVKKGRRVKNTCIFAQKKQPIAKGSLKKKVIFLVARPLRPLAPPPLRLCGHRNIFPYIKKSYFFLSGTPVQLLPHPLSGPATEKGTFLRLP